MNTRWTATVLTCITLFGAGMAVAAGLLSRRETGELLGYPLPDHVLVMGAVGVFTCIVGVMALAAVAILSLADWGPVRRILHTEVLPEQQPVARIGRGILLLNRVWGQLSAVLLLAVLLVAGVYTGGVGGAIVVGLVLVLLGALAYLRHRTRSGQLHGPTVR